MSQPQSVNSQKQHKRKLITVIQITLQNKWKEKAGAHESLVMHNKGPMFHQGQMVLVRFTPFKFPPYCGGQPVIGWTDWGVTTNEVVVRIALN